jgi:hypothetical protein
MTTIETNEIQNQLLEICFDILTQPQEPVLTDCYELDPLTNLWIINRQLKNQDLAQTV